MSWILGDNGVIGVKTYVSEQGFIFDSDLCHIVDSLSDYVGSRIEQPELVVKFDDNREFLFPSWTRISFEKPICDAPSSSQISKRDLAHILRCATLLHRQYNRIDCASFGAILATLLSFNAAGHLNTLYFDFFDSFRQIPSDVVLLVSYNLLRYGVPVFTAIPKHTSVSELCDKIDAGIGIFLSLPVGIELSYFHGSDVITDSRHYACLIAVDGNYRLIDQNGVVHLDSESLIHFLTVSLSDVDNEFSPILGVLTTMLSKTELSIFVHRLACDTEDVSIYNPSSETIMETMNESDLVRDNTLPEVRYNLYTSEVPLELVFMLNRVYEDLSKPDSYLVTHRLSHDLASTHVSHSDLQLENEASYATLNDVDKRLLDTLDSKSDADFDYLL